MFQSVGGGLATTLVATINDIFFLFFCCLLFSKKECSDQKTYLAKVDGSTQKSRSRHLFRLRRPFLGPLAAIVDFAGSEQVPGAARLVFVA